MEISTPAHLSFPTSKPLSLNICPILTLAAVGSHPPPLHSLFPAQLNSLGFKTLSDLNKRNSHICLIGAQLQLLKTNPMI